MSRFRVWFASNKDVQFLSLQKNYIQFLSVSAELGFGVGELHREMLLLLFGQPRRIQDRSSVNHRNVSGTLPPLGDAHAQVPAHLMGLLAGQVVPLLGQIHDHLDNASVKSSENITKNIPVTAQQRLKR